MALAMRLRALALVACVGAAVTPCRPGLAQEASQSNVAAARKHFEKAKAFYQQGAYREAISELEAAHALDPNAKDLVFNLGVVHEKLSDIDEALKWFRVYTTMDLVPQERERADAYIKRLEGAKKEVEDKQAAAQATAVAPAPSLPSTTSNDAPVQSPIVITAPPATSVPQPGPPTTTLPSPSPTASPHMLNGRVDSLTLGAASVAVAGLALGVVMGVLALEDQPASNSRASEDLPLTVLQQRALQANKEALLADVGFGVALVMGAATGYLYLGRSRATPPPAAAPASVSFAPSPGGGSFLLKGCF